MKYRDFFKEDCSKIKPRPDVPNVDQSELDRGVSDETEHTNDKELAKTIALQHLKSDPHYYSRLKSAGIDEEGVNPFDVSSSNLNISNNITTGDAASSVVEPNSKSVDKQTTPGTVFPEVDGPTTNSSDVVGNVGSSTKGINAKTDVDVDPKDPTGTDHVTGTIGSTPSNPNIITKQNGNVNAVKFASFDDLKSIGGVDSQIVPQDISIDIAESKKLLKKMKEGMVPAAGDPSTDPNYIPGKRWTVKYKQ